jgi:hypothetical protein
MHQLAIQADRRIGPSYFATLAHYVEIGGRLLRRWLLYKGIELIGQFTSRDAARQFLAGAKIREQIANLNVLHEKEGVS